MLDGVQVIVAGAGLAGLSAAHDLAGRGADVRVIEARDRVGGRVWTVRDADGVHADAGGELIDAEHQAIRSVARSLRVPMVRVLRGGFGSAMRIGGRVTLRRSPALTWREVAGLLGSARDAHEDAGATWDSMVDQLEGPPPDRSPIFRIEGGAERLAQAMARRLGERLELGCILRAVTTRERRLHISTEGTAGRRHQFTADYLVVALPPSLVVECLFDPPLLTAQAAALDMLPLGAATKVSLRFDRPWWRRRGRPRAFGTNLAWGAVWDAGEDQKAAILTCLGGASASVSLTQAARDADALARSLRFLGTPGAGTLIAPATSWEREPWSRGGNAVFTTAFHPRERRLLHAWHGRITFAGEHTSEAWQGSMNGAVESGARAAAEVDALRRLEVLTAR